MAESIDAPRPVAALYLFGTACVIAAFALATLGVAPLLRLIAYRHFAPDVFLNLVPLALALTAIGVSVAALRRRRHRIGWLLLVMAILSLAATAAAIGGAFYLSSSAALVGADEGSRLSVSSKLYVTVPPEWVAEEGTPDGSSEFISMVPRDSAFPGSAAFGDQAITFSRLAPGKKPDKILELWSEDSRLTTMTIDNALVTGTVVRDKSGWGVDSAATIDDFSLVIHDDPAVMVFGRLSADSTPDSQDDAALLRWFADFIQLES